MNRRQPSVASEGKWDLIFVSNKKWNYFGQAGKKREDQGRLLYSGNTPGFRVQTSNLRQALLELLHGSTQIGREKKHSWRKYKVATGRRDFFWSLKFPSFDFGWWTLCCFIETDKLRMLDWIEESWYSISGSVYKQFHFS